MALLTDEEVRAREFCLSRKRGEAYQRNLDYRLRGSDAAYKGLVSRTEAIAGRNYDGTKQGIGCEDLDFRDDNEQRP